jgi:hypothetical protein
MKSYRQFIPGGRRDTSRIIKYAAEYNILYATEGRISTCYCIPNKYDKNTPGSDSSSAKVSYATKLAQVIQASKGGKSHYGNFYLGQPLNVNYLGRVEGMPGGGGMPPKNRFN